MISSTQRQVAALVAVSVLFAHAVAIGLIFVIRLGEEPSVRVPEHTALRLAAGLYAAAPAARPELLRQAAAAGLKLREIPDALVKACATPSPATQCEASGALPYMPRLRATPDTWLGLAEPPHPPGRPHGRNELAFTIALIAIPTLAISLWASRRVTAPLRRLTEQAEQVDAENVAALKVEGTTEIRMLAEAFNRLIQRLTRYAADQRRMLAAVSHDLRTPLTRLRLRAETIPDPATRDRLVHDVMAMQSLIDGVLSLQQAQGAAPISRRVDLAALLQTLADNATDSGVPVQVGTLAPLTAACDPAMLTRAVENLLENAAKYGGGATLRLHQAGTEAAIEVADTGPGLTDAEKAQVFEPWYRADTARTGNGSGLGLSIVKAVMRALGGRVELADAVPHGLVARLVLPL